MNEDKNLNCLTRVEKNLHKGNKFFKINLKAWLKTAKTA